MSFPTNESVNNPADKCLKIVDQEIVEYDENIMISIRNWLKYNDLPIEEVKSKWETSFAFRRKYILENSIDVLLDWPLYRHSTLGQTLVSCFKILIFFFSL